MSPVDHRGEAALRTAYAVAAALRDPTDVARVAHDAFAAVPASLMLPGWQPGSVLLGHAGISMLCTRWARFDAQWSGVAHAHLAAAAAAIPRVGAAGAGDLLLPAYLYADEFGGYERLLARSVEVHASFTEQRVGLLEKRRAEPGGGLSYMDYDVIAGLTGQGRGLMLAADHGDERSARALTAVLDYLVALTHPVRADGAEVPGWWCTPERYVVPHDREAFPRGDFNVGMAHGVTGPLALLSLAHHSGHHVSGMLPAIRRVVDWLLSRARTDECGPTWPGRIAYEKEATTNVSAAPSGSRTRAGWCYGTTGIAWALFLAGQALSDRTVTELAVTAMKAVFRTPCPHLVGGGPGFCHGRAGVLQAAVRMAAATGDQGLWRAADAVADDLVATLDSGTAFGFRQVVADEAGMLEIDNPSLIDGATGIALALVSYSDARRTERREQRLRSSWQNKVDWDAVFLMS